MSTIKLELTVDANNIELVTDFLTRISAQVNGVKEIKVNNAQEVKEDKPAKAAATKKVAAKKAPEPEIEEEDDDFDDGLNDSLDNDSPVVVTADDLREAQALKVGSHRDAIIAKLKELGAKGISNLGEEHYAAYYNFLKCLK